MSAKMRGKCLVRTPVMADKTYRSKREKRENPTSLSPAERGRRGFPGLSEEFGRFRRLYRRVAERKVLIQ